jgi:hypothetical protein
MSQRPPRTVTEIAADAALEAAMLLDDERYVTTRDLRRAAARLRFRSLTAA